MPPSPRWDIILCPLTRDAELEAGIGSIWTGSGETSGRPRIHAALRAEGERVGQKRVGRLMKTMGIEGATKRRWKTATTKRDAEARPAPDLVMRHFTASGPDQLSVADIAYVPTWAGWLYLAVVLDVWSRRVVGWAMATHMRTEPVEAAVAMPLARCPRFHPGVLQHAQPSFGPPPRVAGPLREEPCSLRRTGSIHSEPLPSP